MNICGLERRDQGAGRRAVMIHEMLALADCPHGVCTCCVQCCAESILIEGPSSSWTCSLHKLDSKDILIKLGFFGQHI